MEPHLQDPRDGRGPLAILSTMAAMHIQRQMDSHGSWIGLLSS